MNGFAGFDWRTVLVKRLSSCIRWSLAMFCEHSRDPERDLQADSRRKCLRSVQRAACILGQTVARPYLVRSKVVSYADVPFMPVMTHYHGFMSSLAVLNRKRQQPASFSTNVRR